MTRRYRRRSETTGEQNNSAAANEAEAVAAVESAEETEAEETATVTDEDEQESPTIEVTNDEAFDEPVILDMSFPAHEIDRICYEHVATFATGIERVTPQLNGDELHVTILTVHGVASASAKLAALDEKSIRAAVREIERKISGE